MTPKQRLQRINEQLRNDLDDNDAKLEAVIEACDKALADPHNQAKWRKQADDLRCRQDGPTAAEPCADCREHLEHGRWMDCQHAACVRALIGPCPAADWVESLEGR